MSNTVCLTEKQQKFYNYFINYYKSNGSFPTPAQTARDMGGTPTNANAIYGALFLKGTFTKGQALTSTYRARHTASAVTALNIADFKLDPKPKAKPAAKVDSKNISRKQLAALLVKLLSEDKLDTGAIAELIA